MGPYSTCRIEKWYHRYWLWHTMSLWDCRLNWNREKVREYLDCECGMIFRA